MTQQDREWVRAMIQAACHETLDRVGDEMREFHVNCPAVAKWRNIFIGIAVGLVLAGGTGGALIMKLVSI